MSAENPADHHIFLEAFTGQRGPRSSSIGISLALTRGRVDVATPQAMAALLGEAFNAAPTPHVAQAVDMAAQFAGFSVTLPDIPAMAARLAKAGIASRSVGKRLIVPASAAFGTAIIFEPET